MRPELLNPILSHYPTATAWDRFHLMQRLRRCPYEALLEYFPAQGKVLDIGCGFGHLGWLLRESRPALEYFGTDIDQRKIALGQAGIDSSPSPGLHLFAGDAQNWRDLPDDFSVITLFDVLYLLPRSAQENLLDFALTRLGGNPQASLLLKILPPLQGWERHQTWIQERMMVFLGKTKASGAVASTQNPEEYFEWAARHGLKVATRALKTVPASTLLVITRRANEA